MFFRTFSICFLTKKFSHTIRTAFRISALAEKRKRLRYHLSQKMSSWVVASNLKSFIKIRRLMSAESILVGVYKNANSVPTSG